MKKYFEAVTLGSISLHDDSKRERFYALVFGIKVKYLVIHFLLLTIALNFPVMVAIAKLPPFDAYSRLSGDSFLESNKLDADTFNTNMIESGYGINIMLPLIGMAFGLILILQIVFYGFAVLFSGWSRMMYSKISFKSRLGIFLFSSTLPVFGASIFGMFLPTVHIIIYYLIVIIIGFKRSITCQNG
ncbi:MAG: hypothetical protein Ta2B_03610 [Termitinemataceae bacterium]|nr:MAG: hypothetical protein Ta2B_03610 [Termitinemataceae bacterium]